MVINICKKCNKIFYTYKRKKIYCSKYCLHNRVKKRVFCICLNCKKKFWKFECRIKDGRGRYCSKKCQFIASKGVSKNVGKENGMWIGDKIGYKGLHNWIRRHKPKPKFCVNCYKKSPFDVANISGKYKRDITDFEWLCRSCHTIEDYQSGVRGKIK